MKNELFNEILSELKEIDYNGKISLSCYGEPLLDDRIEEFARKIKKEIGSSISISTNGDYIDYQRVRNLASAGIDTIIISQHDIVMPEKLKVLLDTIPEDLSSHIIFQRLTEEDPLVNRGGSVPIKRTMERVLLEPWCGMMYSFFITYAGDVRLCCNDYFNKVKLGNINEESIMDIWNKKKYVTLRKNLKKGIFDLDICKKCRGMNNE
jgi:radical SAM protein with 4Fe4S-binding SPASM domain